MSNKQICTLPLLSKTIKTLVVVGGLVIAPMMASSAVAESSRLATFAAKGAQPCFALSVTTDVPSNPDVARHIAVLVDTSASQVGKHREDSLEALVSLLNGLSSQDRVQIFAADLDIVPMNDTAAPAKSPQIEAALAKLRARAPLGATDIAGVFTAAAKQLSDAPAHSRRIAYIGDGVSKARLLESEDFQKVIDLLKADRVSVSSVALGGRTDVAVLAALANHTGGKVLVASEEFSAQGLGHVLAKATRATVAWPLSVKAPEGWAESFPASFPPMRADRDSIVVGSLKDTKDGTLSVEFDMDGQKVTRAWPLKAEASTEDFAYLPKLVEMARVDNGASLPTAGSPALREVRRILMSGANGLSSLAGSALQSGDLESAKTLAEAALEADPGNTDAEVIRDAIKRREDKTQTKFMQFEGTLDGDGPLVLEPIAEDLPPTAPEAPSAPAVILDDSVVPAQAFEEIPMQPMPISGEVIIQSQPEIIYGSAPEIIYESAPLSIPPAPMAINRPEFAERDQKFLDEAEQKRKAREGLLKVEVRNGIATSREMIGQSPEDSVQLLKMLLETIRRASDVSADVRSQLTDQVGSATRSAQREVINFNIRQAEVSERQAQAAERTKILAAMRRNEVRTVQIMDRFNSLMDEGRYTDAEEVAYEVEKLQPNAVMPQIAITTSRMAGRVREMERVRDLSERGTARSLALVREAAIPMPDEPALVYPPADFWEELTIRRAPYASLDLAKPGSAEARIFEKLDEVTDIDFADTSLQDAISILRESNDNMNIVLDEAALDISGIDPETPITQTLNGITLRSALRLILKGLDLTYIVKDEVLLITTIEEAETQLVTKVYPVADLVMPITSLGGGMQGMGGVGGGQLGGALNGGGGGGGGGMGGGGMGGGGGGGMFAVEDVLRLGGSKKPTAPAAATATHAKKTTPAKAPASTRPGKNIDAVSTTGEQTAREAWHAYFQQQAQLPLAKQVTEADIRQTVRTRMNDKNYGESSAIIQSALANGYVQPWMYEALGLALQADNRPKSELERALMSSVDLASNMDELFYAATYMSRVGLDERALTVLEQVAAANPTRPEPFAMALKVAQQTENIEALRWASVGVLEHAWPAPLRAIEVEAKRTAKATLMRLLKNEQTADAEDFRNELNNALVRDCTIDVSWTGEADVDILVQEPGNTICSLETPRTNSGGVWLGDASSMQAKSSTDPVTESYVCSKGFSGKYKLMLRPIWGQVTSGKVKVKVTTHAGTSDEQVIERSIELGDDPSLVVFDLNEGRLKEPLKDHMIQTAAQKQIAVNRTVLAQQIDQDTGDVVADLAFDRALGLLPQFNRSVGFRPVITTLPEGTNMSATAIISADRRYVRVTASPSFTSISRVDTFNFVSGDGEQTEAGGEALGQ